NKNITKSNVMDLKIDAKYIEDSIKNNLEYVEVKSISTDVKDGYAYVNVDYKSNSSDELPIVKATKDVLVKKDTDLNQEFRRKRGYFRPAFDANDNPAANREFSFSEYESAFKELREAGERSPEDFLKAINKIKEVSKDSSSGSDQLAFLSKYLEEAMDNQKAMIASEISHEKTKREFRDLIAKAHELNNRKEEMKNFNNLIE